MNGVPVGGTWVWVVVGILVLALLAVLVRNILRK